LIRQTKSESLELIWQTVSENNENISTLTCIENSTFHIAGKRSFSYYMILIEEQLSTICAVVTTANTPALFHVIPLVESAE